MDVSLGSDSASSRREGVTCELKHIEAFSNYSGTSFLIADPILHMLIVKIAIKKAPVHTHKNWAR